MADKIEIRCMRCGKHSTIGVAERYLGGAIALLGAGYEVTHANSEHRCEDGGVGRNTVVGVSANDVLGKG